MAGVLTNVTAFARWEQLTHNPMELCAAVCASNPANRCGSCECDVCV